ncbi:MAG: CRISPR-associated endonuclease Cas1 [Methyloprofundus sp.]|nr:CRISPR-associated endonuclease Cas1 [Methyloprofundus sp.]
MKTLFIEKPAMELRYERACLLLYHQGKRVSSVPLAQLERIVVAPHVALSAGVLGLIAEKEVALLVLNSRYPARTAVLAGTMKGDIHRRMRQYQLHQDEAFRRYWSLRLVRLKIVRQNRLLSVLKNNRPDLRYPLTQATTSLMRMLADFDQDAETVSLESLRGKEGAASAVYFKAYTRLFPAALGFVGRNRRPPKDPVNACLSLAYTLFYQEAIQAIKAHGLDTALGCYHELYYNRESLACDLLEPLRPLIDAWVYRLFQHHTLRLEDFTGDEACLLHAAGKQRFYEAFRQTTPAFRRLLRGYARFAANIVCDHESPSV